MNSFALEASIFVFLLRKVWEYFLEVCQQNNSLFGITWNQLRSQLDRAEVAKNYVLNPLAPEFVPNRLFHITRQSAEAAAAAAYLPQAPLWHYMGPQHLQYSHGAPYQVEECVGVWCLHISAWACAVSLKQ